MRRHAIKIFLTLFTLSTFSAFGSAKLAFVRGKVMLKRAGQWKKATIGMKVSDSDSIKTGKRSMVIIKLSTGSRLKLRANTLLDLNAIKSPGPVNLKLDRGSVFAKVKRRGSGRDFRISTATVVAGVRGTQFVVAFGEKIRQDKDPEIMLCVNEGSVEVQNLEKPENSVILNEGEGIVVIPGKDVPKGEKLPWIKKFNWNMDTANGSVDDDTSLKEAYKSGYTDLLDQDYD